MERKNIKVMNITAGMGTIESYEKLVTAGADEVFCGYVPDFWNEKYGNVLPLNRREVLFYHVQIGTLTDMKILKRKVEKYHVPVVITFNSLCYTKTQIDDVIHIIVKLIDIGFYDYIIADINLIRALCHRKIKCNIHVSGELGEFNSKTIKMLLTEFSNDVTRITRIIFHRKMTFEDMRQCILQGKRLNENLEYEAFCMNEKCHYTGGFCNSLHCDELSHICRLEYELDGDKDIAVMQELAYESTDEYVSGESGCGLCAIGELINIGITHLKVVGRGQSEECMIKDIVSVKRSIEIKEPAELKHTIFSDSCSENCYYL